MKTTSFSTLRPQCSRACLVALVFLPILNHLASAAPLPGPLLADEAMLINDRFTGHGFGQAVAVDGNLALVGVDGGDPFASVHVFERTGLSWRRVGRLSDSRANVFDGFGRSVAVEGDTIVVGDPFQNNAAYAFVRNGSAGLHAWNITDNTTTGVGPSFIVTLPVNQYASLVTNAWRYMITARMVHDLEGSVCMYFSYGSPTNRFIFFLDFTDGGDLVAQINGIAPTQFVLTTNGAGADDYHLHELDYNPTTRRATYRFDGRAITNWPGEALTGAEGIRWGAGSTLGRGSINVHQAHFEVTGTGVVLADYNAGTPSASPANTDPLGQGWSVLLPPGAANTSQEPLTPDIASIWTEQARVTVAGGGANDALGSSIDISGNTMVVGAPGRGSSGAAFVFSRQGSNWTQQAILTNNPPVTGGDFGRSVAIHGNTIVVGASGNLSPGPAGRAYVFVRSGSNWTQQAAFTAPGTDNQAGNRFGFSVDLSNERLVIGAPRVSPGGAIYVAERTGTQWSALTRLVANPVVANDAFGTSVAMDGDNIVVAAPPSLSSYLFARTTAGWGQFTRRVYSSQCEDEIGDVAIDHETVTVGVLGCADIGARAGIVYVQVPNYPNANAVANFANQLLYYSAAGTGALARELAAFRYKHLLYGPDATGVRARFENMASFYGENERDRATEAEEALWRSLSWNPDSALLGHLLLDVHYDRTVAETILAKDVLATAERTRLTISSNAPTGFIIDIEIPLYRQALAKIRFALQSYFDLLNHELAVQQLAGTNTQWASQVLGFSTEWTSTPGYRAIEVLGQPDVYPQYGDLSGAWASATDDGVREFLELGFANGVRIDAVSIYETWHPGAVDKVSVRQPGTGQWQEVWSGPAGAAGAASRIFTVKFPLTSFPVDAVRIDLNSPAVEDWNEIDAVSISGPGAYSPDVDNQMGHRLFRTLVPVRPLMAATYTNAAGAPVPVIANATLLTGYKDLVLLFDLLREHGRAAGTLGRLLVARNTAGDLAEAKALIADTQRFLFLQGAVLVDMFPALPPPGDSSGLAEAISGWRDALSGLSALRDVITGEANLLGFAPDFLMLVENFQDPINTRFDSFDSFRERLSLSSMDSPLTHARDALALARASHALFLGYEDQLLEQFAQNTEAYESRLFDIVGARPGQTNYSDVPTTNPGSELDQQYRSLEVARLRILKNRLEVSNLTEQINIELRRAVSATNAVIRYGNQRASITRTIGHINATQAGANALADTLSPEKLLTRGVVVGAVNTVVQAGGEEWKGQLEAQKEELAAREQAELEGIESGARIKTMLLGMSTLAVDSLEAAALLQQETARLAGLYREKSELEARMAEANTNLASRYFADPAHRHASEASLVAANLSFGEAQRWLFFMSRALEYKWNTPFANFQYPPGGRLWSALTIFKLRTAEELVEFYNAMLSFDALINRGKTLRFDWFSMREDFMGLKQTNDLGELALYIDPRTGQQLDALSLFRTNLLRTLRAVQGGQEIVLEFNTVRQAPGGFFFVGPTFDLNGNVISKGRFLDKIDYLQIRLPGNHTLGRAQLAGNLTYGGTSFIRNFNVGHFDPLRPDRLVDELTAYSTRYWFYDPTPNQMRWRFTEGLTIDSVEMQLTADPRVPPTVTRIEEFKERSVAATGWRLTIPLVQQNVAVLRIHELNDVEIYFHHYSAQRQ